MEGMLKVMEGELRVMEGMIRVMEGILRHVSDIRHISDLAGDLIYAVSILGITGNDLVSKSNLVRYLKRVRKHSLTPFVVGFGIRTRDDVLWFNNHSDGAVVGSAIIEKINNHPNPSEVVKRFILEMRGN